MANKNRQTSRMSPASIVHFLLMVAWIFGTKSFAFLATERKQNHPPITRTTTWRSRNGGSRSSSHCNLSLHCAIQDDSDTLESLSEFLSHLLSVNETDAPRPGMEGTNSQDRQRQRDILTRRFSKVHDDSDAMDSNSKQDNTIYINRTYVEQSTLAQAGKGLFASQDCPKGTLLTCYPGDALMDLSTDDREGVIQIDTDTENGGVIWGTHTKKAISRMLGGDDEGNVKFLLNQEYMLRAICDHWGIVAIPEIFRDDDNADPSYLGHFANDGAQHPPRDETELANYVLESTQAANAMHQPCMDCHMVTIATKDVKAGEEIFVTYGPDYWREQASFVASQREDDSFVVGDVTYADDDFDVDDEDLEDYDFDYDYYDEEAESILADIIASEEEDQSESSTRGKGFG